MAFSSFSSGHRGLLQLAGAWGVAAVVIVIGVARFEDIRTALGLRLEPEDFGVHAQSGSGKPKRRAESAGDKTVVIAASPNGHFETRAQVNGRTVEVMVDTGATMVALTHEDAAAAGIHPSASDFRFSVSTANGSARVAQVMLDQVSIGDITVRDIKAVVAQPGRLTMSLLGMTFLGELSKTEISRGQLTLQE